MYVDDPELPQMTSFENEAVLLKYTGRTRPTSHNARLGLLLNRVKRMRVPKGARIEIVCGDAVYSEADIARLLNSANYQDWLSRPRRPHYS